MIRDRFDFEYKPMDEQPCLVIVDDEQGILDSYKHYLAASRSVGVVSSVRRPAHESAKLFRETYRLLLADTGEKAVELVAKEYQAGREVQAGFFDMKMPGGIDGLETIRRIREIDENMYCVIVTAYQDRSLEEIGRVFGASYDHWDYMNKPFTGNEIVQKARNAVAFWRNRRKQSAMLKEMEHTNRKLAEEFKRRIGEMDSTQQVKLEKKR